MLHNKRHYRIKIFDSGVGEAFRYLRSGNDGCYGVSVAHRFAHGHDVGHDVLGLERPHVTAHSAETHLHLISYANTAGVAYVSTILIYVQ